MVHYIFVWEENSRNMHKNHQIREVSWEQAQREIKAVREAVFIVEQRVTPELEWDGCDPVCSHVLAQSSGGETIGTARMLPDGQIGRMAVLQQWRGLGVGSALLKALLEIAKQQGFKGVFLNSQVGAIGFYSRHGFEVINGPFMDAGIPHVKMTLCL